MNPVFTSPKGCIMLMAGGPAGARDGIVDGGALGGGLGGGEKFWVVVCAGVVPGVSTSSAPMAVPAPISSTAAIARPARPKNASCWRPDPSDPPRPAPVGRRRRSRLPGWPAAPAPTASAATSGAPRAGASRPGSAIWEA